MAETLSLRIPGVALRFYAQSIAAAHTAVVRPVAGSVALGGSMLDAADEGALQSAYPRVLTLSLRDDYWHARRAAGHPPLLLVPDVRALRPSLHSHGRAPRPLPNTTQPSLNDTGEGSPPLAAAAALIAGLSSLNGSTPYTHMRKYDAHRANLTDAEAWCTVPLEERAVAAAAQADCGRGWNGVVRRGLRQKHLRLTSNTTLEVVLPPFPSYAVYPSLPPLGSLLLVPTPPYRPPYPLLLAPPPPLPLLSPTSRL